MRQKGTEHFCLIPFFISYFILISFIASGIFAIVSEAFIEMSFNLFSAISPANPAKYAPAATDKTQGTKTKTSKKNTAIIHQREYTNEEVGTIFKNIDSYL